jgi:hypothetical protein
MKCWTAISDDGAKPAKTCGHRPSKHPWHEIEADYVHGQDLNKPGSSGMMELVHEWPSQAALARRYGVREEQVSRRFARLGSDGMTVHQRQETFQAAHQRQLDDNFLVEFAGREIRLRKATLDLAELALCQVAQELTKPQGPDALVKLMAALRRAQEIGMAALSRPATRLDKVSALGADDWTLMREVWRGTRMVPELDRPASQLSSS